MKVMTRLDLYTLQLRHHLPNGLKSVEPGELKGSRLACHQPVQNSISARRGESAHCCTYAPGNLGGGVEKMFAKKVADHLL